VFINTIPKLTLNSDNYFHYLKYNNMKYQSTKLYKLKPFYSMSSESILKPDSLTKSTLRRKITVSHLAHFWELFTSDHLRAQVLSLKSAPIWIPRFWNNKWKHGKIFWSSYCISNGCWNLLEPSTTHHYVIYGSSKWKYSKHKICIYIFLQ
jgi:hypothetical protein